MRNFFRCFPLAFAFPVALGVGLSSARAEPTARLPLAESPATKAMPLASHRAIYAVSLLKSTGNKSPTAAQGRVSYEFSGSACDGYSQVFRQITELQPAEGATRLSDTRSATFEDGNGTSFNFDVKTSVDRGDPDVVDGHADRRHGDLLAIRLSKPNVQTVDVDNEVLFPTAHLRRIIAAAKAGQQIFQAKVFDGSDNGKKVYDTTAVIGRPLQSPADDRGAARVAVMDQMTRWPVTISYFESNKKDGDPDYTLGFELYENGVSRALRFNYGDFVLAGDLKTLELMPAKTCAQ